MGEHYQSPKKDNRSVRDVLSVINIPNTNPENKSSVKELDSSLSQMRNNPHHSIDLNRTISDLSPNSGLIRETKPKSKILQTLSHYVGMKSPTIPKEKDYKVKAQKEVKEHETVKTFVSDESRSTQTKKTSITSESHGSKSEHTIKTKNTSENPSMSRVQKGLPVSKNSRSYRGDSSHRRPPKSEAGKSIITNDLSAMKDSVSKPSILWLGANSPLLRDRKRGVNNTTAVEFKALKSKLASKLNRHPNFSMAVLTKSMKTSFSSLTPSEGSGPRISKQAIVSAGSKLIKKIPKKIPNNLNVKSSQWRMRPIKRNTRPNDSHFTDRIPLNPDSSKATSTTIDKTLGSLKRDKHLYARSATATKSSKLPEIEPTTVQKSSIPVTSRRSRKPGVAPIYAGSRNDPKSGQMKSSMVQRKGLGPKKALKIRYVNAEKK